MSLCEVVCGDSAQLMCDFVERIRGEGHMPVIVTDPPFNIGYHYKTYKDRMPEEVYLEWIAETTKDIPSVIIHYPEMLHKLSMAKQESPLRIVLWVYPSNTARQHRDIAFYGVTPDFRRVTQPYRNQTDKRIKERMAQGKGARLYDWWEINQVKNVNKDKTSHPCQMPVEVMRRLIGILPDGVGVIDPFCGSGTTGVACKMLGVPFIGCDIDEEYCNIARRRLNE